MKTKKITAIRYGGVDHTWDISVDGEQYLLPNGVVSHNTSSQVSNSTNGIEPVRSLITTKQSKHGVLKQVVPEFRKLKNKYELLWNQRSPEGYLRICAVLQKWVDQGISVNTSYNPRFYAEEKIPMSEMLKHILMFYKLGGKQLYYNQTNDNQGEINMDKIADPVDACDSCVI